MSSGRFQDKLRGCFICSSPGFAQLALSHDQVKYGWKVIWLEPAESMMVTVVQFYTFCFLSSEIWNIENNEPDDNKYFCLHSIFSFETLFIIKTFLRDKFINLKLKYGNNLLLSQRTIAVSHYDMVRLKHVTIFIFKFRYFT